MHETHVSSIPLIPDHPLPPKKRAEDLSQLCENIRAGLDSLVKAARCGTASPKSIKAAQKVEKKYRGRLDELCSMDFSTLTEDEISGLSVEVSTIITAVRKAKDLLR